MDNIIRINQDYILSQPIGSIADCETIRQISLLARTVEKNISSELFKRVEKSSQFCGLYPEVITLGGVLNAEAII